MKLHKYAMHTGTAFDFDKKLNSHQFLSAKVLNSVLKASMVGGKEEPYIP